MFLKPGAKKANGITMVTPAGYDVPEEEFLAFTLAGEATLV